MVGVVLDRTAAQDVREVLDLTHTSRGVTEVAVDWGRGFGRPVAFAGDVDGDGFDEFFVPDQRVEGGETTLRGTYLVFGQPASLEETTLAAFRTTYLRNGDPDVGIAVIFGDPFTSVGDLDGDGYDDFLVGSQNTDWNGFENSGLALLLFGAPNYPAEVDLEDPASAGLRSVRIFSSVSDASLGSSVSRAGDLNGDGVEDIAVAGSGFPGT
jgi:hypothetical protein